MSGPGLTACTACGWHGRPRRLWCPRCGGSAWVPVASADGVVLATTTIRRAGGADLDPPSTVALVRLEGSGTVIAAVPPGTAAGDRVSVAYADGAFAASPP